MVMGMTMRPLPAITALPVLIKSSDRASLDGSGTLFTPQNTEYCGLHVVSKTEAFLHLDKWKRSHPELWRLISGVALMQRAQKERDWALFQEALDRVWQKVPHIFSAEIPHIRSSKAWKQAIYAYSGLMSNLLQTSRFVIWYSTIDNRIRPGLFCPDWEVAAYAMVGMEHLRICKKPGCGEPFIPGPKTQECCTQAHANALRVALWKVAHPERAKEQARRKSPLGRMGAGR